jgi:hypothetical protein
MKFGANQIGDPRLQTAASPPPEDFNLEIKYCAFCYDEETNPLHEVPVNEETCPSCGRPEALISCSEEKVSK